MSLISIDQFEHFVEEFPEMEKFYTFDDAYQQRYDIDTMYAFGEDIIGYTCTD